MSISYKFDKINNGRIDLGDTSFMGKQLENQVSNNLKSVEDMNTNVSKNILSNITETNLLSTLFFSKANTKIIQDDMRYKVYIASDKKYIIDYQNLIELQIIMRSTYLQYCPHLSDNITKQISYLNDKVVDFSIKKIITELESRDYYINDIQKMPVPLERPVNMSNVGLKNANSIKSII